MYETGLEPGNERTENDLKDRVLYKPRGCEYCSGIGFRGRAVKETEALARGAAGCFFEVFGIATLCPFSASGDMA